MSKKDFESVAEAVSNTFMPEHTRDNLVFALMANLKGSNPRFDEQKFCAACQPKGGYAKSS